MSEEKIHEKALKNLDPQRIKSNLMRFAFYILLFEALKDTVIGHLRSFFSNEFRKNQWVLSEEYRNRFMKKGQSELLLALDWLKEFGAIDDADIEVVKNAKDVRNQIAHEMHRVAWGRGYNHIDPNSIIRVTEKVQKWWVVNIEAEIDPETYPDVLTTDDVTPMLSVMLDYIRDIIYEQ